ncbi:MAG: ABC transporter ATP-binding protein [Clostridia bacterium]|nr:ABC transporter ATP-binding protein [Clostridia bacterium]
MELLEARRLSKVYKTRRGMRQCAALRNVSFTVNEGEFLAIMGPSGSGKTTLLNILASLDKPTGGEVLLDGRSFADIKDSGLSAFRRTKLGFVFQDFNLLDSFSLKDNILLPLVLSKRAVPEMEARLRPVAELLHIETLLDKYPYEVSGGEKQRAAVARAMITDPRLILADEPTGSLDSQASRALLENFSTFNRQGKTILMVTHSAQAASYAGRVLFIRDGEIFSQIYRGEGGNRAFFDRIVASLTLLTDGGGDIA